MRRDRGKSAFIGPDGPGLVLSFHLGDQLVLTGSGDPEIKATLMKLSGNEIELHVQAAPSVRIHRRGISERIAERAATGPRSSSKSVA